MRVLLCCSLLLLTVVGPSASTDCGLRTLRPSPKPCCPHWSCASAKFPPFPMHPGEAVVIHFTSPTSHPAIKPTTALAHPILHQQSASRSSAPSKSVFARSFCSSPQFFTGRLRCPTSWPTLAVLQALCLSMVTRLTPRPLNRNYHSTRRDRDAPEQSLHLCPRRPSL